MTNAKEGKMEGSSSEEDEESLRELVSCCFVVGIVLFLDDI